MIVKFIAVLKAFVEFNQCHDIRFDRTNRKDYMKAIVKGFS